MQVDTETYKRYQTQPELADAVTGNEGQYVMRRDATSDYCVKFEGGLCGIQNKYGEKLLGDACHFYPRAVRTLGSELTMTATLSCPEIARLALFHDDAFTAGTTSIDRQPETLHNYLPQELNSKQALTIHGQFVQAALDKNSSAERNLIRIFVVAESLSRISKDTWPDAVPFYLERADGSLPEPEPRDSDPVYLLQALCGLVSATKNVRPTRLAQTIHDMERALHVTIPMDSLKIAALPDSAHTVRTLYERWQNEWQAHFAPVLRHYLTAQLSLALFPFGGFGNTLTQRIAIIGVRLATVKLALMSACQLSPAPLAETDIVRVIQSLSRFLDHLADPEFSIKIYQETGWLQKRRLRALLGDK